MSIIDCGGGEGNEDDRTFEFGIIYEIRRPKI
jgi:hypothetical protein